MSYFLSGFMEQHSGVDLIMDVTNKSRVVRSLEKNEVGFTLVSLIPEHLKLNRVALMQNKLFLVGNTKKEIPKSLSKERIFKEFPMLPGRRFSHKKCDGELHEEK